MRLDLVNGPNLNRLGRRQVEIYGGHSLDEIGQELIRAFPEVGWTFFQSNHEGALVDRLQWADDHADGLIINPGGLSHTSVVLLDALLALRIPIVEVHVSQVAARESFRRRLLTARAATALVCGMGPAGYAAAARHLLSQWNGSSRQEKGGGAC
ncbi:MAG: type II 3-dehydroquinate dehydratase [bacterium]|jgi:3-dehydroquinate dehydratase-2|nr:type II 3-dehydroquinate dehydratase [bacterium]